MFDVAVNRATVDTCLLYTEAVRRSVDSYIFIDVDGFTSIVRRSTRLGCYFLAPSGWTRRPSGAVVLFL